jgi:hypothetical protein
MLTDEQYGHQLGDRLRYETDDLRPDPDLARKLRRRVARRTWAIRAAIATPVAAAAAVAILVTTAGPGGGQRTSQTHNAPQSTNGEPVRVETVAYVQAQTIDALSRASSYVIAATNTYDGGHYDEWIDKATQRYRNDVYTSDIGGVGLGADGKALAPPADTTPGAVHLSQSHSESGPAGNRDLVSVDYDLKQWSTGKITDMRPPGTGPDITDADSVRQAIADGTVELLGHETVSGHDTLHLRLYGPERSYRLDMWVDAKTYLPVQETAAKSGGKSGGQEFPAVATVTTRYSWLPRTEANLAHLVLTAPPGFKRVK